MTNRELYPFSNSLCAHKEWKTVRKFRKTVLIRELDAMEVKVTD